MNPIPFQGFDERRDVRVYYPGILPHWRQDGCTYFVTYRLADALPESVIREFEYERELWFQHRGIDITKYKGGAVVLKEVAGRLSKADQQLYARTMATKLHKYLDAGHGSCHLRNPEIRGVVSESLEFFHDRRVWAGDYVVMPNHVHAILRPLPGYKLEDILQSIKSYTASRINKMLGAIGRVWMRESYDHIVRDYEQLEAFQQYVRANPEKARLREDEYTYRGASYRPDE